MLGSLEAKIDTLLNSFTEHRAEMREALASHEKRIKHNEEWRSRITGLAAGAMFVTTALYGLVFKLLSLL